MRIRPDKIWFMIFVVVLAGYTVFFALNQINMHAVFLDVSGHDFGQFNQSLWNLIHQRAPTTTIGMKGTFANGSPPLSIFRNHLFLIHLLLAPLYYLFPSYNILLVVYVLSFSVSGLVLYLIARLETRKQLFPFVLASSYIFSPIIWRSYYFGFRPLPLAIPFLFLCFYCIRKHKVKLYFVFLFLALFCKENIAVFTFFLGVYIFLEKSIVPRNKFWGSMTMAVSLLYFYAAVKVIIPLFSGTGGYHDLEEVSVNKVGFHLRYLFMHHKGVEICKMVAPVVFLPFFSRASVMLIPGLLTVFFYTFTWNVWQNTPFVACVYLATALAAGTIIRRESGLLPVFTAFMILFTLYFNILPLKDLKVFKPAPMHRLVFALKKKYIPDESSVLTQTQLIPPFSNRDEVNFLDFGKLRTPSDWEDLDADYLFLGCQRAYCEYELDEILALKDLLEEVRKYKVIAAEGGYIILRKDVPSDFDDREYRERGLRWLGQTLQHYLGLYRKLADLYPDVAREKGYFRNLDRIRGSAESSGNPQAKNNNNI